MEKQDLDVTAPIKANPNISKENRYNELPRDKTELLNFIKDKILKIKSDKYIKIIYQKIDKIIDHYDEKDTQMLKKENKLNEDPSKKRGYTRSDDVGGSSYDELAKEFGFAGPQGAKAAVEKALRKLKFMADLPEEDRNFLILSAMDDFINIMEKRGNFSKEDVELLRKHPEIVQVLDGFKEHLHKFILRGMRDAAKLGKESDTEE